MTNGFNKKTLAIFNSSQFGKCRVVDGGIYRDSTPALKIEKEGNELNFSDSGQDLYDGEPIATLTVYVEEHGPLAHNHFIVKDWSENEQICKDLLFQGIFEEIGIFIPIGYVNATVWKLADGH